MKIHNSNNTLSAHRHVLSAKVLRLIMYCCYLFLYSGTCVMQGCKVQLA